MQGRFNFEETRSFKLTDSRRLDPIDLWQEDRQTRDFAKSGGETLKRFNGQTRVEKRWENLEICVDA